MIFIRNSKAFVQSISLPGSFEIETLFLQDRFQIVTGDGACEDRVLDGPASGGKGLKCGPYKYWRWAARLDSRSVGQPT